LAGLVHADTALSQLASSNDTKAVVEAPAPAKAISYKLSVPPAIADQEEEMESYTGEAVFTKIGGEWAPIGKIFFRGAIAEGLWNAMTAVPAPTVIDVPGAPNLTPLVPAQSPKPATRTSASGMTCIMFPPPPGTGILNANAKPNFVCTLVIGDVTTMTFATTTK
jgi:hypothetical protein